MGTIAMKNSQNKPTFFLRTLGLPGLSPGSSQGSSSVHHNYLH